MCLRKTGIAACFAVVLIASSGCGGAGKKAAETGVKQVPNIARQMARVLAPADGPGLKDAGEVFVKEGVDELVEKKRVTNVAAWFVIIGIGAVLIGIGAEQFRGD